MSNESGNTIVGGVILVGLVVVVMSLLGAFRALEHDQYLGGGLLMLAASLPVSAAIYGVLRKK